MSLLEFLAQRARNFSAANLKNMRQFMCYPCALVIDDQVITLRDANDYSKKIDTLVDRISRLNLVSIDYEVLRCRTLANNGHADVRIYVRDGCERIVCIVDASYLCSRDDAGTWSVNMVEMSFPRNAGQTVDLAHG